MSAHTDFGLSRIGQIAVPVRDLDRAVAFYRDALGLPFLFRVPNLAFFDCAGTRLMLSLPERGETEQRASILYFAVDDIQGAYEALCARDVPFDDGPHVVARMDTYDLWMAFFRDPDGNLFGVMSEVARA
jgi:methylmalonyl-CoA/ethylmalonyl-CoA epimerase